MSQAHLKQVLVLGNIFILAILSLHSKPATADSIHHPAAQIHSKLNQDVLQCTVYELDMFTLNNETKDTPNRISCASDFHGPTVFLKGDIDKFFSNNLVSGETALTIPTHLISATLKVDLDDPKASELIEISHAPDNEKRSLRGRGVIEKDSYSVDFEGTFGILVVRVTDNRNHSPTYTAEEISQHLFTDELTMTNQYRACSNNKLNLVPADGSDLVGGVLDITVDVDLSRTGSSDECMIAADSIIDSSSFDLGAHKYTMYICPDVTDFGVAVGVANVRGAKSWYLDTYGSMPTVLMHEFGHNLGFYHSRLGTQEYGDPTGVMGGQFLFSQGLHWGKMCFNAAKTYSTGWYADHHSNISPNTKAYNGNIVDINSVSQGHIRDRDDVVVRLEAPNNIDHLYFMLDRLEGITSDMLPQFHDTHANRVNIISQSYPQGVSSDFVASLASGEEYVKHNWADTGKALHIKVCSIADDSSKGGAKVITYLEGQTFTTCEDDNEDPTTSAPTSSPACADSTLKMFIRGGAKKGCSWVAANNTEMRCMIPGVASHCPATCGTCILCTDSAKRFQLKTASKDIKSCSWVRNFKTGHRCSMEGVASACRETCGTCSA